MLYAIVDKVTGWSLKLMRDGYHFMPYGFPALLPKSVADSLLDEYIKNNHQCFLRLEIN
jgi:hypothetical protein